MIYKAVKSWTCEVGAEFFGSFNDFVEF